MTVDLQLGIVRLGRCAAAGGNVDRRGLSGHHVDFRPVAVKVRAVVVVVCVEEELKVLFETGGAVVGLAGERIEITRVGRIGVEGVWRSFFKPFCSLLET